MNIFLILFGKLLSKAIISLNLGGGATWPGHIALSINPKFIRQTLKSSKTKIILIAGTNGKTTTSALIEHILKENANSTLHNSSGANLLNGIASAIILGSNIFGKIEKDYSILEVDENSLPLALEEFTPNIIVLLNLFRDQLDRYGEVNTIAQNWQRAIEKLPLKTVFILNANDPTIAFLGNKRKNIFYFGLNEKSSLKSPQSWADSVFCPICSSSLSFSNVYFSHIGSWSCENCDNKTPNPDLSYSFYPLAGVYNKLNTLAAVLTARKLNIDQKNIDKALKTFAPVFGRQEKIKINNKSIQILLSKNPTGFNQSLDTVKNAKSLLLALNDRIPDGRDISWIWDVDFKKHSKSFKSVIVAGDRAYELGIRLKYASFKNFEIEQNLTKAIQKSLNKTKNTLYVLPTYSAMLDIRKILTGKSIL